MKHLILLFALVLAGCGPDLTPWKGAWTGSGSVNTGRQPQPFTGKLVIADTFAVTSDAQGTPAVSFSCALTPATVDAATVAFKGPTTFQLTASPADGCTRQVTMDDGTATRTGDALEATVRGKVKTECTGGSSTVENFLLSLVANR